MVFSSSEIQRMRVTQVLYSGLGGHGSVAFSILDGDTQHKTQQSFVFYGIEPLKDEYKAKCEQKRIDFESIFIPDNSFLMNWWKSFRAILRQKPNVVILHSISLAVLIPFLRLLGIGVIAVDHTPNATKRKMEWLMIRICFMFSSKMVFLTDVHANEVRALFNNSFPKDSVIINNGINTDLYAPKLVSDAPPFSLMMQARFSHTKDFQTFVRAAAILKKKSPVPFKIRLAGDGDTHATCVALAKELDVMDVVHFEGMLSEPQVVDLLAQTHIYVHSSLSEAMSTSVMQALSCGKPVIASDISGMNYLVRQDQTGWLFPVGDEEKLAELILNAMSDNNRLKQIGENARIFSLEKLGMETMFERYFALME